MPRDIEIDEVMKAIKAKGIPIKCPECGGTCALERHLLPLGSYSGKGPVLFGGSTSMHAGLICTTCGLTRLYNVTSLLGLKP